MTDHIVGKYISSRKYYDTPSSMFAHVHWDVVEQLQSGYILCNFTPNCILKVFVWL